MLVHLPTAGIEYATFSLRQCSIVFRNLVRRDICRTNERSTPELKKLAVHSLPVSYLGGMSREGDGVMTSRQFCRLEHNWSAATCTLVHEKWYQLQLCTRKTLLINSEIWPQVRYRYLIIKGNANEELTGRRSHPVKVASVDVRQLNESVSAMPVSLPSKFFRYSPWTRLLGSWFN